jgi:hypothetical protein
MNFQLTKAEQQAGFMEGCSREESLNIPGRL